MLQTHFWVFLYFCSSLLMSLMSLTFFRCCLRSGFFNFAWHWTTFPSEAAAAGHFCPAKVQLKWTKPFSSMDPEAEMEKVILNWTELWNVVSGTSVILQEIGDLTSVQHLEYNLPPLGNNGAAGFILSLNVLSWRQNLNLWLLSPR